MHLQHASPRSLEVPQGTFYCKSRCGGRENKVDFPNASALAFLPGPRCSTRGFGTSVQHMSCTLLYGRNHKKCVPCAYVSDNFAAARGTANLSEIYMSASPEGPFTSIANANSSVGLSTVTRLTTTVFYDTSFNTPSMWRMSIWPPDPPNAPCCPRPFSRACTSQSHLPHLWTKPFCSPCRVGAQPLLKLGWYRVNTAGNISVWFGGAHVVCLCMCCIHTIGHTSTPWDFQCSRL